jgi:hypothetical protein
MYGIACAGREGTPPSGCHKIVKISTADLATARYRISVSESTKPVCWRFTCLLTERMA